MLFWAFHKTSRNTEIPWLTVGHSTVTPAQCYQSQLGHHMIHMVKSRTVAFNLRSNSSERHSKTSQNSSFPIKSQKCCKIKALLTLNTVNLTVFDWQLSQPHYRIDFLGYGNSFWHFIAQFFLCLIFPHLKQACWYILKYSLRKISPRAPIHISNRFT